MQKFYYKRKCKSAQGSVQNVVKSKVGVKKARLDELKTFKSTLPEVEPGKKLRIVAVNISDDDLKEMRERGVEPAERLTIENDSWKEAASLFKTHSPDVVFLKLQADELQDVETSIIALCFMKSCPAVILAVAGSKAVSTAEEFTSSTWPVFTDMEKAAEHLKVQVPIALSLRDLVEDDIANKVKCYKKVHVAKHFGKRAAVALIPFAVHAVNLAGMVRLVKRMMKATGMAVNKQVASTVGKHSAVASIKVAAIDEIGDVYQYLVAATILAEMGAAFGAGGASAALATLDAVDAVLLGSVSVITGAISAIGAYFTRPQLVDAIGKFLASLQVIYLLNEKMRRPVSAESDEDDVTSDEDGEEYHSTVSFDSFETAEYPSIISLDSSETALLLGHTTAAASYSAPLASSPTSTHEIPPAFSRCSKIQQHPPPEIPPPLKSSSTPTSEIPPPFHDVPESSSNTPTAEIPPHVDDAPKSSI